MGQKLAQLRSLRLLGPYPFQSGQVYLLGGSLSSVWEYYLAVWISNSDHAGLPKEFVKTYFQRHQSGSWYRWPFSRLDFSVLQRWKTSASFRLQVSPKGSQILYRQSGDPALALEWNGAAVPDLHGSWQISRQSFKLLCDYSSKIQHFRPEPGGLSFQISGRELFTMLAEPAQEAV